MAVQHGSRTKVYLNVNDISTFARDFSVHHAVDTAESSTFGQPDKTYVVGLEDGRFTLGGVFDNGSTGEDAIITPLLGSATDVLVTAVFGYPLSGTAQGLRGVAAQGKFASYDVTAPIGDVVAWTAELASDGDGSAMTPDAVWLLNDPGTVVGTGGLTGTGVDLGAAGTNGAIGQLHVIANTFNATAVVKIQHATTLGGAYSDLITFTTVGIGATTQERKKVAGAVNEFFRAVVTTAAGSGSLTMVLVANKR